MMLSKDVEYTLNVAFQEARDKNHEFITVEHLLLALLENPSAAAILRSCGADLDSLKHDLTVFLEETTPILQDDGRDTQPTLGFQRVLQRAVFHVQSSGKREVGAANLLVAIFGEQDSQAVYCLNTQNITRLDIVNYISHGITKAEGEEESEGLISTDGGPRRRTPRAARSNTTRPTSTSARAWG
jgi:ATP-dependent Clp protease ATP-binding subunit ClpA